MLHSLAGDTAPALFAAFQTSTTLYLVNELAPFGSLADHLAEHGELPEIEIRWWAKQLLQAVEWIHGQGFAHRWVAASHMELTAEISSRGISLYPIGEPF